jgi:uncharacterized protein YkwD
MRRLAMRRLAATALVASAAVALLAVGAVPAKASGYRVTEHTMLRLINKVRVGHGLRAVREYRALERAAHAHSTDMIVHDYFAHSTLAGLGVGARARRAGYGMNGWHNWTVGEVIAWGCRTQGSPRAILRAWMHSSLHRSVILDRRWRDAGVGWARGTFKGLRGVSMYTIDFGRRRR